MNAVVNPQPKAQPFVAKNTVGFPNETDVEQSYTMNIYKDNFRV